MSYTLSDEIVLVKKTNLVQILEILNDEQRVQFIKAFGISKPNFSNLKELSLWASDAIVSLGIKKKDLATEANVNPCDISYLLNEDERLSGTGRREKIINKLIEKLEQKYELDLFSKSS